MFLVPRWVYGISHRAVSFELQAERIDEINPLEKNMIKKE
jgi:hypothetical protein